MSSQLVAAEGDRGNRFSFARFASFCATRLNQFRPAQSKVPEAVIDLFEPSESIYKKGPLFACFGPAPDEIA